MDNSKQSSCKILYVLASRTWGGGEQYVSDLMENLPRERYECHVVTPESDQNRQKLLSIFNPDNICELRLGSLFDIASASGLARLIREKDINIVHVNKFADAFLAVWARSISGRNVRIVMTRHLIRKGKIGHLYQYLYRQLDLLIFVSDLARKEFLSRGAKIDSAKVQVVHNGIMDMPQNPYGKSNDTVTIAYVGRVVEEKGLHILIEALASLTKFNFRLKIIGSGRQEYTDELKRIATRNGLAQRVVFTGFTDDVNGALQEAEIGVLPSIVREGSPISILEYMRSELAVVASDNGGQSEYLTEGVDSILVPNGDKERLAEAIGRLLSHPEKCREMGEAARKAFLAGLTYDKLLHKMINLYDGLCR